MEDNASETSKFQFEVKSVSNVAQRENLPYLNQDKVDSVYDIPISVTIKGEYREHC